MLKFTCTYMWTQKRGDFVSKLCVYIKQSALSQFYHAWTQNKVFLSQIYYVWTQ
jgi:hypothetical protein